MRQSASANAVSPVETEHQRGEVSLWPGSLVVSAMGPQAQMAVAAGLSLAQRETEAFLSDADLMSRSSLSVLPRSEAGRNATAALKSLEVALPAKAMPSLPSPIAVLPGAIVDAVVAAMAEAAGEETAVQASLADAFAWNWQCWPSDAPSEGNHRAAAKSVPRLPWSDGRTPMALLELVGSVSLARGGAVLMGQGRATPLEGLVDHLGVLAQDAARACCAAAAIARGCAPLEGMEPVSGIQDPYFATGFAERFMPKPRLAMEPGEIFEILSAGMRVALTLRERHYLRDAAISLKGRGRATKGLQGDRLLRFGVSEWR